MSGSDLRSEIDLALAGAQSAWDAAFVPIADSLEVYNEAAFHYFLSVERERSIRSGRPLLLMLLDIPGDGVDKAAMDAAAARRTFLALGQCLRETDFIGWYEREFTAGAVLTQRSQKPSLDAAGRVRDRVMRVLSDRLPGDEPRVRVRLYQMPFGLKGRQTAWR